jgi:hypothetical protein
MPSSETRRGFMDASDRLTARQLAAIGRVAVLWSEVEWAMERILGPLALVPSLLGYILTDKLGPDNRIGAIRSLIEVHKIKYRGLIDGELLTEIQEYLPSLGAMKDDRNYIVHSVWAKASETQLSRFDITATARSGADVELGVCQPIKTIEEFGDQVEGAAKLLWDLGARIPTAQPASLEKLHELERDNRRRPGGAVVRQLQPKSFAQLQRKPARQPKQGKQPKRAEA